MLLLTVCVLRWAAMQLDPNVIFSTILGCATGYAAIKVEIKFLWRAIKELKEQVAALKEKKAA